MLASETSTHAAAADALPSPRHGWPVLSTERAVIMGVLNVTPNSFSDGGRFAEVDAAVARGLAIAQHGAAVLDIGGESSHPQATPATAADEQARVLPVIRRLAETLPIPISIDTYRAATADAALKAGARIVNDIWGFARDPEMAPVVAAHGAGVCLMHNRLQTDPNVDIVDDMLRFFERSLTAAAQAGVAAEGIVLDPGIGFGKTFDQNLVVLAHLPALLSFGRPLLVGASRKGFIGAITGKADPASRVTGSVAAHVAAVLNGASIIRAHDIEEHVDALAIASAILRGRVT